jgi:hypothetical protein
MQMVSEEISGNVVVSPVSLATLLSILQQGSGGNTEAQLTEVLNLATQQSRQGYSKLTRNLKVKQWLTFSHKLRKWNLDDCFVLFLDYTKMLTVVEVITLYGRFFLWYNGS